MPMNVCHFIESHRLLVAFCAAITGALVSVIVGVLFRKRHRHEEKPSAMGLKGSTPKQTDTGARPSECPVHPLPVPPTTPPSGEAGLPSPPMAGNGISADWAEFVRDRLEETNPANCANETQWALGVIDFLDELQESNTDASDQERIVSAALRSSLLTSLSSKGFEPLDSGEWNPETQRAVSVVRKPDATGTTILGKGSTGLSRDRKIIRKQEVKILTKGN